MKKSLVAALTGAMVLGVAAPTFAAVNPFSDVPQGHWAYNSVAKLASEGIIEGYGDGTYRGNRNITRYEMAQMVARALARYDQLAAQVAQASRDASNAASRVNTTTPAVTTPAPQTQTTRPVISGASRAELDRLAYEFREELDALNVRVEELEKHADMVKWNGKIEYTYGHLKNPRDREFDGQKKSWHDGVFRLEPSAYLNEHWTANARFDASYNGKEDSTADVKLKRIFAEGKYDKFDVKLGRFGYCPAIEDGIVADTVLSGAEVSFGSKWKITLDAGRVGGNSDEAHYSQFTGKDARGIWQKNGSTEPTDFASVHLGYNPGDVGLYGQASYYYAKDKDFKSTLYSNGGNEDKAGVWAVGLGYKVNDMFNIHGAYAKNSKADGQNYGWDALAYFGNYNDAAEAGNWAIWGGYSRFGENVALASSQGDDVQTGTKGWHVGAAYAPWKHVGILARYSDGKWLDNGDKYKKVFGRVEFMF